jgi:Transposase DDE domain
MRVSMRPWPFSTVVLLSISAALKALHTLSAYATSARLILAQLSVPEKTNEIAAIPDLLDELAAAGQLEGALVTIDAMGCQVEIADKIVAHKADYVLALKGNQPTLEADTKDYPCGGRGCAADRMVTVTVAGRFLHAQQEHGIKSLLSNRREASR